MSGNQMTKGDTSISKSPSGALLRIVCGSLTLGLSLLCVYASFNRAIAVTGRDALTFWGFFVWGLALAFGGLWLMRGRSKGKAIIFARDRKRLLLVALMAALVVGMLIYFAKGLSFENDDEWPLLLQTMFANLFASLFFLPFDREDYKERDEPKQWSVVGRQKAKRLLIITLLVGVFMLIVGIVADVQVESWWVEGLHRIGGALLGTGAVLGYRLRKSR
jgi:hypothetical protein